MLKKYNQIWKRVEKLLKVEFDSKPVYGDDNKYIKIKIKIFNDSGNRNFQGKKIPKENPPYKCLAIIMLDSVIRANKKYYPQTLLDECKYEQEKIKMKNLIDDDLEKKMSLKSLIVIQIMKQNLMINLMNNLLKDKKENSNNNKSLIVYVNHALLGFYLCQSV